MYSLIAAFVLSAFVIVDGDTLKSGDHKIRLWGIDAAEINNPGGFEAKAALLAITRGQALTCEEINVDRYGRTVARCFLPSGADISCLMVNSGHARDWPKYSGGYYAGCEN